MTVVTPTLTGLAGLTPVGLVELVDRAELLTRVDRKYLVPTADLDLLIAHLRTDVRVLEIDRRRTFDYRSVYFDTDDLQSYLSTARRRRLRFKVRLRSYLDSDLHFLEVKTRGPRGVTVKHRLPYDGSQERLDGPARTHVETVLRTAGVDLGGAVLRPVLTTAYARTTLLVESSGSRMTIDTGLVWSGPTGGARAATTSQAVVETKSSRGTSEVDRLLWSLGRRPSSISKYGTGLAALRPDLPANRWRPILRRHITCPPQLTQEDPS